MSEKAAESKINENEITHDSVLKDKIDNVLGFYSSGVMEIIVSDNGKHLQMDFIAKIAGKTIKKQTNELEYERVDELVRYLKNLKFKKAESNEIDIERTP